MLFFYPISPPHGSIAHNGQKARLAVIRTYVMLPTLTVQPSMTHQPWARPGSAWFLLYWSP